MSSKDDERDIVADEGRARLGSPISAADMLTRSLRRSPRKTTTPTRKLFPDNIDQLAPGMTPTSRNRPKRKSVLEVKTPQKRTGNRGRKSQGQPLPSSQEKGSESVRLNSRLQSEQTLATPRATLTNLNLLQGDYSVISGKRRARESEDSVSLQAREHQFDGWGREREESPMDLLRRLASAPGRIGSPSENGESMLSISQQLEGSGPNTSRSPLKPGSPIPGNLTQDDLRMPPPSKRQSNVSTTDGALRNRYSIANTSLAASEVGQARRAARQSQLDNLFSDALPQDTSGNRSIGLTTFKKGEYTLAEESLELDDDLNSFFRQASNNRETDVEDRPSNDSTRRFEDIEASIQTDGDDRPLFFTDNGIDDSNPYNVEDTITDQVQETSTIEQDQSNRSISRASFALESNKQKEPLQGEEEESGFDFLLDQEGNTNQGQAIFASLSQEVDSNEESSQVGDESLDESKELQLARLALLRRRRAKKKAKRYSSVTGHLCPSLPPAIVKGLFTSFTTPSPGIGTLYQKKKRIGVERGATEAVEDLSHHFFAQFTQALVTQAEQINRRNISEKDVIALMTSQGHISSRNSLAFLARKYLPRELSDLVTSTTASESIRQRSPRKGASAVVVEDTSEEQSIVEEEEEEEEEDTE